MPGSPPPIFSPSQLRADAVDQDLINGISHHPPPPPPPPSLPPPPNRRQRAGFDQRQRGKLNNAAATKKGTKPSSIIIGKNVNAGIVSFKGADLTVARYVGHAELGTETDDIRQLLGTHNVDIVSLEKAAMKHARFASFKLVVKKSQLSIVENPDIWPAGILIGRWWEPKAASTPESDALGTGNG